MLVKIVSYVETDSDLANHLVHSLYLTYPWVTTQMQKESFTVVRFQRGEDAVAYVYDMLEAQGEVKLKTPIKALSLLTVLESRFGLVDGITAERIYDSDLSELDRLLGKAALIPSLDALFNGHGEI